MDNTTHKNEHTKPVATVVVDGLRVFAYHGVFEQERRVGNMFSVDVRLDCDCLVAMKEDRLDHAVSYAEIVDIVKREMAIPSNLLENVVFRIVGSLREAFPACTGGTVALYKLQPPVSAELDRAGFVYSW